jgi:sigma-B regulation protein RsbU (phosphoserine phosphatase)
VNGVPLGIVEEEEYREATRSLERGDLILFYTDGISEAFDDKGEMFDLPRLDDVLAENSRTAQSAIDAVLKAVDRFTGGKAPGDDRTLVAARVT